MPWNKLIKKVVSNNKTPIRIHFGGLARFLTGLSIRHLGIANNMFFVLFSSKHIHYVCVNWYHRAVLVRLYCQ